MLKLFVKFLLLVACVSYAQQPIREIKWVKIYDFIHPEFAIYFDIKTMSRTVDEDGDFGVGVIAYHRSNPITIDFGLGKKTVTTLARHYMADCKHGRITPMEDFYFNNSSRLPGVLDLPVGAVNYESSTAEPTKISKDNPIFKTLCPTYI